MITLYYGNTYAIHRQVARQGNIGKNTEGYNIILQYIS